MPTALPRLPVGLENHFSLLPYLNSFKPLEGTEYVNKSGDGAQIKSLKYLNFTVLCPI